jgi:pantoate--beta-alanine ligase
MAKILMTVENLRSYVSEARKSGKTIGFVPTMGALHDGHLKLAQIALTECDVCIVSIFVNPKQFAPHEDFERYPRNLERDTAMLEGVGVQAVFAPTVDVMYPPDFQTSVSVGAVAQPLEGKFRPHFFTGVATVVARLLLLTLADKSYFGEKDYQQLLVIKRLQADLAIPTAIIGVPTIREPSGLALSSRNAYLTPAQRSIALSLSATLKTMAEKFRAGVPIDTIENWAKETLLQAGFEKVDYITLRDAVILQAPSAQTTSLRALGAAWLGKTRLIDNTPV